MQTEAQESILILGGFLSRSSFYLELESRLGSLSGKDVRIVNIPTLSWLSVSFPYGWIPILKRLERTINDIHTRQPSSSLTLIGHSLGGVLGYLYLASPQTQGYRQTGHTHIRHLITLGSPLYNRCRWLHGGPVSRNAHRWVHKHPPQDDVLITCVASKCELGNSRGTPPQQKAFSMYKKIAGEGDVWGDGIVPVSAALLPEAKHIILEAATHFRVSGKPWYGSAAIVAQWWSMVDTSDLQP